MANKNKTPLLRPMRTSGSTLYVFPSASEDIGLNLQSGTTGVAMSNYVLLNFTKKNFGLTEPSDIVKSLLNYAMNFETVLLNETTYNYQEPYTVTENVFWHWMLSHGTGSNTKDAAGTEHGFSLVNVDSDVNNIWREVSYKPGNEDRLVQCMGTIDAGNSLSTEFGMFNETYVNVPSSYGNGPVFFRAVSNADNVNYKTGHSYPETSQKTAYIQGRTGTDFSYLGDVNAEYDNAQQLTYNPKDAFELVTDYHTIEKVLRSLDSEDITVNSFDDINVDYDEFLKDTEYSMSGLCEFKFNAMLLYYSTYDLNDAYKQPIATNLFGIVFLDGGAGTGDYKLAPILKRKSFKGQTGKNAYFGNGYSFRVNIKTMSVYDNTDARIDDNTTTTSMYSEDFNDVIANFNKAIEIMNTNVHTTMAIQDQYMAMNRSISDVRTQMDSYKKEMTQYVDDQVSGRMAEAVDELERDYAVSVDEAVKDIKEELGFIDADTETDDTLIMGASSHQKDTYTLGASRTSNRTAGSLAEINRLNNEIENLRRSLNEESILAGFGIIIINGVIPFRGKKPDTAGTYFKTDKNDNISSYIRFDGTEYTETVDCQKGKMYSYNGSMLYFDGTTCKPLGE